MFNAKYDWDDNNGFQKENELEITLTFTPGTKSVISNSLLYMWLFCYPETLVPLMWGPPACNYNPLAPDWSLLQGLNAFLQHQTG